MKNGKYYMINLIIFVWKETTYYTWYHMNEDYKHYIKQIKHIKYSMWLLLY